MLDLNHLPYVPAKYHGGKRGTPTLIVIHTGETSESANSAEGMAAFFAAGPASQASTQLVCDNDSIVRCVPDDVVAYGASGGVNSYALHIELAGRAAQTAIEWADPYSRAVMANAARAVAAWARAYAIPTSRKLDGKTMAAETKAGRQPVGICGHVDVTDMATILGHANRGHWDPGPGFPWVSFLALVADELATHTGQPTQPPAPPALTKAGTEMRLVRNRGTAYAVDGTGRITRLTDPDQTAAIGKTWGVTMIDLDDDEFAALQWVSRHVGNVA